VAVYTFTMIEVYMCMTLYDMIGIPSDWIPREGVVRQFTPVL